MVLPALIAARISNQHTSKHAAGWLNKLQISGSLDVLSSLLLSGCGCSSRAMSPLVLSEMGLPQVALGLAVAFEMQLPCFSILLESVFPCWLLLLVLFLLHSLLLWCCSSPGLWFLLSVISGVERLSCFLLWFHNSQYYSCVQQAIFSTALGI